MSDVVINVTSRIGDIDWAPDSEYYEILQCVRCILATYKGSVPLDREFGIDHTLVDKPLHVARAKLASEIIPALKEYEPRVELTNISWEADEDGILSPNVQVKIVETE